MCLEETVQGKERNKKKVTREVGQRNHISPLIRHPHSTIEASYTGKEQQEKIDQQS